MDNSPDANIGLGALLQLLLTGVAAVWAAVDGRRTGHRHDNAGPWVLVWLLVSVVVAVVEVLLISIRGAVSGGGFYVGVLTSDLMSVTPISVAFLAVPSILALLTAASISRRKAPPRS